MAEQETGIGIKSMALFQIILIISLSIAIPMSIRVAENPQDYLIEQTSYGKNSWQLLKELLFEAIPLVSAQDTNRQTPQVSNIPHCCERTTDGQACLTVQTRGYDDLVNAKCDFYYDVKIGACEDTPSPITSCNPQPDPVVEQPTGPSDQSIAYCCEEATSGAVCLTIEATTNSEMSEKLANQCAGSSAMVGACESAVLQAKMPACQLGCFVKEGVCSDNTPKSVADKSNGQWTSGSCDLVGACDEICCIIGDEFTYTTRGQCETKAEGELVATPQMKAVVDEAACKVLQEERELSTGCCITPTGDLTFMSENACQNLFLIANSPNYAFYKNQLCSSLPGSLCDAKSTKSCVEGKEEVYWLDSCGNQEGIVGADSSSCSADSSNINNANCGYCSLELGSVCREDGQGAICVSTLNENTFENSINSGTRRSGDSWCVYDSATGEGQDAVGSRHFKVSIINGEQIIEPCADKRGEVCAERIIDTNGDGEVNERDFSEAFCITNPASLCTSIEDQTTCGNDVPGEGYGCYWYQPGIETGENGEITPYVGFKDEDDEGKSINPLACLPKTPIGLDMESLLKGDESNADEATSANLICSQGTVKCLVTKKKSLFGGSKSTNAECLEEDWAEAMNNRCMSLGDCGASINIAGKLTRDGYELNKGKPPEEMSDDELEQWREDAESVELSDSYMQQIVSLRDGVLPLNDASFKGGVALVGNLLRTITGKASNCPIGPDGGPVAGSACATNAAGGAAKSLASPCSKGASSGACSKGAGGGSSGIGDSNGLIMTAIAGLALSYFAEDLGLEQNAINAATMITTVLSLMGVLTGGAGAIVLIFLSFLFGFGKTKKTLVEFTCAPALPPAGGADCDLCDNDSRRPCTAYRCASLGTTCELINEEIEGQEECVDVSQEDNGEVPKIIGAEIITEGYEIPNFTPTGFSVNKIGKECVDENDNIEMHLETDKYARCKFDLESTESMEDMAEWVGGDHYKTKPHVLTIFNPGASLFEQTIIEGFGGLTLEFISPNDGAVVEVVEGATGTFQLKVQTGGTGEGNAECSVKFATDEGTAEGQEEEAFTTTGGTTHTHDIAGLTAGDYIVAVNCIGSGESSVEGVANIIITDVEGDTPGATEIILGTLDIPDRLDHTLYLRCEDRFANVNTEEFEINFCSETGDGDGPGGEGDTTPPQIQLFTPHNGAWLTFGTTEQTLDILVDEPANCKWDENDVDYDSMANPFVCKNSLEEQQPLTGFWECSTTLPGLEKGSNFFNIRCEDQPFNSKSKRNAMQVSESYALQVTGDELIVNIINPIEGETINLGASNPTIHLEVETIGGASAGDATCSYNVNDGASTVFTETGGTIHSDDTLELDTGDYTLTVSCEDVGHNIGTAQVSISISKSIPIVVRNYYQNNELIIITNEDTLCKYGFIEQGEPFIFDFDAEETLSMNNNGGTYGTIHTAPLVDGADYHIVCRSELGNEVIHRTHISGSAPNA